jgi:hypothetical protein
MKNATDVSELTEREGPGCTNNLGGLFYMPNVGRHFSRCDRHASGTNSLLEY